MNRRPSELALVAVSLVCVLILAACNCAPTLRYITITPSGPTIVVGAQEAFTATGYYSNGAITPKISVSWSSNTTSVATINGTTGVATGVAPGTTTITATALGITSTTTTLTVAAPTAIAVTPLTTTISVTGTQQYDAMASYAGGTQDVTAYATWTALNTGVVTLSTTTLGLATAVAAGTTQVTATLDGLVGTATLTVTAGTALVVTPATASLAVGNALAFTVAEQVGTGTQPLTTPVTWSSPSTAQANVALQAGTNTNNANAIVTAFSVGSGTVTITATEGTLTGSTTITIDQGTTKYAYVSDYSNGAIDSYTVSTTTAPYLTGVVTTPTTNYDTFQTVIDPNGLFLFGTSTITGATYVTPYPLSGGAVGTPGTPVQVSASKDSTFTLVDPYGRFLFLADQSTTTTMGIYVYTINPTTGALTLVSGSPFTTNLTGVWGLAIDQSGTYLYASNALALGGTATGTTLASFTVNPTTGSFDRVGQHYR